MGLSESSLTTITKPLSFLSHCKMSRDSQCCQSLCGDNNHCMLNIVTHEYISSDSDEHIDNYSYKRYSKSLTLVVIIFSCCL